MNAAVIQFPPRRSSVIWLTYTQDEGWMVLAGEHGWLHGDRAAALNDARWLAQNLQLPIREVA